MNEYEIEVLNKDKRKKNEIRNIYIYIYIYNKIMIDKEYK